MKLRLAVGHIGLCSVALTLFAACEEKKPAPPTAAEAPTAPAATAPAASPTSAPTPKAAEPSEAPSERPAKVDAELTTDRRSAVEAKYPAAKGFVVAKELEDKLKANKALKDKKAAVAAFDKAAKGKWVLFSGPLVNLTDNGFDLGVVYTPQLPNDPIGMSRQFFEVTLTDVEGYSKDKFKAGNVVVVLARYNGAAKAGPGNELIAAGVWK